MGQTLTGHDPENRADWGTHLRMVVPGLALVALLAWIARLISNEIGTISSLTAGVALGALVGNAWGAAGPIPRAFEPGIRFAASTVLRFGVVLLGFRLTLTDVVQLGISGLIAVVLVVVGTFFGTRWLASKLGVNPNLGLLIATGYSICGASAIAAMNGVVDAEEEETAYAVALVTLCGSLSIIVFPFLGYVLGLGVEELGAWAGAGVHDVAQVIATATVYGDGAVEPATVVKLTRVVLLAPLVASVAVARRGSRKRTGAQIDEGMRRAPVPLFVVGFLVAVVLRSSEWIDDELLATIRNAEKWLLTVALVGLGLRVRVAALRRLGGRPLVLGLIAWVWVAAIALAGVTVTS